MELPLRVATRQGNPSGAEPEPRIIDSSVLIADDDANLREVLRSLLVNAGYLVFVAATGRETLAFSRHLAASLALLDLMMPHGNGLVTCEALRKLPGWSQVPVVMLTGACTDQIVRAALRVGVTGFVAKPFTPDDLMQRVGVWTGKIVAPRRSDPRIWRRELDLQQYTGCADVLDWNREEASPGQAHAKHDESRAILRAMHAGRAK